MGTSVRTLRMAADGSEANVRTQPTQCRKTALQSHFARFDPATRIADRGDRGRLADASSGRAG
jgi:hypothetical protein